MNPLDEIAGTAPPAPTPDTSLGGAVASTVNPLDSIAGSSISLPNGQKLPRGMPVNAPDFPEYLNAVNQKAQQLGVNPNTLLQMAKGESNFDPTNSNSHGYMGLYQIHRSELQNFGIDPDQYLNHMSRAQQLAVFTDKYLPSVGYKAGDGDDQLMLTLPFGSRSARMRPMNAVIYPAGSKAAQANPGWRNGNGDVTVGSALAYYQRQFGGKVQMPAMYGTNPLDSFVSEGSGNPLDQIVSGSSEPAQQGASLASTIPLFGGTTPQYQDHTTIPGQAVPEAGTIAGQAVANAQPLGILGQQSPQPPAFNPNTPFDFNRPTPNPVYHPASKYTAPTQADIENDAKTLTDAQMQQLHDDAPGYYAKVQARRQFLIDSQDTPGFSPQAIPKGYSPVMAPPGSDLEQTMVNQGDVRPVSTKNDPSAGSRGRDPYGLVLSGLGKMATGLSSNGYTYAEASGDPQGFYRAMGQSVASAAPQAAALAATGGASSLGSVAALAPIFQAFGGVPSDPEGVIMSTAMIGALHGLHMAIPAALKAALPELVNTVHDPNAFAKALDKLDVLPEQKAAIVDATEEIRNKAAAHFGVAPEAVTVDPQTGRVTVTKKALGRTVPAETPPVETTAETTPPVAPPVEPPLAQEAKSGIIPETGTSAASTAGPEATGLARAFEDPERVARGEQPTEPQGTTLQQIADRGQQLLNDGTVDPAAVIRENRVPTNDEGSAILAYKRQLANRSNEITTEINAGTADPAKVATLQAEQDSITKEMSLIGDAAQRLRGNWHEGGMLLQTAFEPDFSVAGIRSRGQAANMGEDLVGKLKGQVEAHANTINGLQTSLKNMQDQIAAQLKAQTGPAPAGFSRDSAITRIRKLTGAEASPNPVAGGMKGGQRGTVNLDLLTNAEKGRLAADIQNLAKQYIREGSTSMSDILGKFNKDLPHLSNDNVLDLLSGKHKTVRQALTAEQLATKDTLGRIRQEANFRRSSTLSQVGQGANATLSGVSRGSKMSGHLSAPFMQGRKGLFVDPKAWLQSWGPMLKGLIGGDKAANMQMARFMNDPQWASFKEAGLGDVVAKQHGASSEVEESLKADLSSKIPVLGKIFEHSNATFNGFMNELRFQMMKNASRQAPTDRVYLQDMANEIGSITGRSTSALAKKVAPTGGYVFSPRYTVSKWEYQFGKPYRDATSPLAKQQILKNYAKVIVGYGITGTVLAKAFGGKVSLDPKDPDFGKVVIGNNHIDLFGQDAEAAKLIYHSLVGKTSESGKTSGPSADPVMEYLKNKLTPMAKLPFDATQGIYTSGGQHTKSVFGEGSAKEPPFDYLKELRDLFMPITVDSSMEGYQQGAHAAPFLNPFGIMDNGQRSNHAKR